MDFVREGLQGLHLYNDSALKELLIESIDKNTGESNKPDFDIISVYLGQLSRFSMLLYATIYNRANNVLCILNDGTIDVFDLNRFSNDSNDKILNFYDLLDQKSIVTVNIKKVIADLSDSHEHFKTFLKFQERLDEGLIDELRNILKEKSINEITVRLTKDKKIILHVSRKMKISELKTEIDKLGNRNDYHDIIIKTRDGQVNYFEKIEIYRL